MKIETKRAFAVTLFKVLCIYSVIEALSIVADKFPYWVGGNADKLLLSIQTLVSALLLVVFGLIVWWRAEAIASSIFKSDKTDEIDAITPYEIQVIAFSTLGLFFLCESLPSIVKLIIFFYRINSAASVHPGLEIDPFLLAEKYSYLLFVIIQSVIGIYLLLGSSGLVKLIRAMRGQGNNRGRTSKYQLNNSK